MEELESFRKFLELSKSPETVKSYMSSVRKFLEFLKSRGKGVREAELKDVVDFLYQFKPRYAHRHAYALISFFKYIGMESLANKIPSPRYTTSLPRWIEEEKIMRGLKELEKEVEHSPDKLTALRNLAVIALAYDAALRIGEVVRLNRSDVDLKGKKVLVHRLKTKGGEPEDHYVPISDYAAEILRRYLEMRYDNEEALFVCGEPPHRCSKEMIRLIFKKFAKIIGDESLTFHTLRHSAITHKAIKGVDLTTLAKYAHHKNPSSTLIYIHLATDELRRRLLGMSKEGGGR